MMQTTICAPATALGGAIAIIRVSGNDAISITSSIFSKDLSNTKGYSIVYGDIKDPSTSQIVDNVLISIFKNPHSYTGEDSVEISCHGSDYICHRIIELLCQNGCVIAQPGEFTKRAFLNGKLDLSQAEAVADLIASKSEKQHNVAISHLKGGVSNKLHELREQLLTLMSLLELELDFSDHEDLEFADRSQLNQLIEVVIKEIDKLLNSFITGNAIKNGIAVSILGAPNVGKSTLLNTLLGENRAIVSSIQGTTRDTIEDTIVLDGQLYRFIDTAGIRNTDDIVEQMGIERSVAAAEKSNIILLMRAPGIEYPDISQILRNKNNPKVIYIINKCDETPQVVSDNISDGYSSYSSIEELHISALNKVGIDELKCKIKDFSYHFTASDLVITSQRHQQSLMQAKDALLIAKNGINNNIPGDLLVEDLKQAISNLTQITGNEITTQEVLNSIFSRFCIGK